MSQKWCDEEHEPFDSHHKNRERRYHNRMLVTAAVQADSEQAFQYVFEQDSCQLRDDLAKLSPQNAWDNFLRRGIIWKEMCENLRHRRVVCWDRNFRTVNEDQ